MKDWEKCADAWAGRILKVLLVVVVLAALLHIEKITAVLIGQPS